MKYAKELFLSFILFSLLMFSPAVSGEESKTKTLPEELQGDIELVNLPKWVTCTKQGIKLLDMTSKQYGEPIIATGEGEDTPVGGQPGTSAKTQLIIMWNNKSGSYTLAEMFPDGGACVLLVGQKLTFLGKFKPDADGKDIVPELEVKPQSESEESAKKILINYDSSIPVNKPVH